MTSTHEMNGADFKTMPGLSIHMLSAVVAPREGRVILQKGAFPGREEYWGLPEAHTKYGEDPAACARRAVTTQAGVRVQKLSLVDVQSSVWKDTHWDLWFIYKASVEGSVSSSSSDWDVRLFSLSELPEDLDPEDKPELEKWASTDL